MCILCEINFEVNSLCGLSQEENVLSGNYKQISMELNEIQDIWNQKINWHLIIYANRFTASCYFAIALTSIILMLIICNLQKKKFQKRDNFVCDRKRK